MRDFVGTDLRGARFVRADLSGVVMRGVELRDVDIDAPWIFEAKAPVLVNGVDVVPLVEAELNRRFPGREDRQAAEPARLRNSWAALERTWEATMTRVAGMPSGAVDVSVGGEFTFAQTLRHLVMATDTWLRRAIQGVDRPYHPIGVPYAEYESDGFDMSVFSPVAPDFAQVRQIRSERLAMVRSFLATVTVEKLAEQRRNPWAPDYPVTVLECVHTILQEEWEHHRYALRDLAAACT